MSIDACWEQGSEFHFCNSWSTSSKASLPWSPTGQLYGSGRDAYRSLLEHGKVTRGWKRVWVPSYFCQEVVAALVSTGLEIQAYPDSPLQLSLDLNQVPLDSGDVVVVVNFFGLRTASSVPSLQRCGVEVIEDHTHDPFSQWAWSSKADWCVASLRKVLPVPAGGALWSPACHSLPSTAPVSPERHYACVEKWTSMALKEMYLKGRPVEKQEFRALALTGEEKIASGPISGLPNWVSRLISTFPIEEWRQRRLENYTVLSSILSGFSWVSVLQPGASEALPFSGILVFDSRERQTYVRTRLIGERVYPAVLWLLENPVLSGIPMAHVGLSERMLSIHCDMRYDKTDMERVASLILQFGEESGR